MKLMVETVPPLGGAAVVFLVAGLVLDEPLWTGAVAGAGPVLGAVALELRGQEA